MKLLYKIEILGWSKYNAKSKPSMPSVMISKRFLEDAKIQTLSAGGKLLYLGLLLRRGDVDTTFIEASHEDLVRLAGGSGQVVQRLLEQLQSLQLLTFEKIDSLYNRIENNIKEKKVNEVKCAEPTLSVPATIKKPQETISFKISSEKEIQIPRDLLFSWSDTYPKEFVEEELKKARSWVLANPHKAPKSAWGRFLNQWLTRGWEKYRTTLKSNPVKITVDDLEEFLGRAS